MIHGPDLESSVCNKVDHVSFFPHSIPRNNNNKMNINNQNFELVKLIFLLGDKKDKGKKGKVTLFWEA